MSSMQKTSIYQFKFLSGFSAKEKLAVTEPHWDAMNDFKQCLDQQVYDKQEPQILRVSATSTVSAVNSLNSMNGSEEPFSRVLVIPEKGSRGSRCCDF